jgi:hypothetical protein
MKKQILSPEDVKRTIQALELYVEALEEEIATKGEAAEPLMREEAEATRALLMKYSTLYEASGESGIIH